MSQMVDATFEDGVLKPHEHLVLDSGTTVRIIVFSEREAGEASRSAFAELERFRAGHPIHSHGTRLNRDQLHERR